MENVVPWWEAHDEALDCWCEPRIVVCEGKLYAIHNAAYCKPETDENGHKREGIPHEWDEQKKCKVCGVRERDVLQDIAGWKLEFVNKALRKVKAKAR